MAVNLSVESCGAGFASSSRQASSNYGVGSDGRVGIYVDEAYRSLASAGDGFSHNNMPPYLAVYMWERVHQNQVSGYNEDVYFLYG